MIAVSVDCYWLPICTHPAPCEWVGPRCESDEDARTREAIHRRGRRCQVTMDELAERAAILDARYDYEHEMEGR